MKKLILILLLLVLLAGGGAGAYLFFFKTEAPSPEQFRQLALKPEVLDFTRQKIPGLYREMVRLERELTLIEGELKRLDDIGTAFPKQKKIVAAERSLWTKTAKELQKTVTALEKQLQTLYVGYLVNRETGLAQIASQKNEMVQTLQAALAVSGEITARLPPPEPRGFIAEIKARFFK